MNPNKKRLRRTMMFLNAQKPSLMKDAYVYKPDCVIFDLEDAVAENQKDAARFSLYHTLKEVNYRGVERVVRINGLNTSYWKEDIRVSVAGGCDCIRLPKCEYAGEIIDVQTEIEKAEKEFNRPEGSTLIMAAIESPRGIFNALELCESTDRLMGIAIGAGDYMRTMGTRRYDDGQELAFARSMILNAAKVAGIQCFDTAYTELDKMDAFETEVKLIKQLGFDGKSIISPKQIEIVHRVFTPTKQEILEAEKVVRAIKENAETGVGVFMVDGKMIDIAFLEGAERTIAQAKAAGVYGGEL
jgi:citrate lyase subunit beta / citryl-CoA lyase